MKYLKTFESYSPTNEEFLGLDKVGSTIKESWEKIKAEFSDSKFVEWTNQNLSSIIEKDPEMAKAASNLGIDTTGDLYSQLVQVGKEVKSTPEGQKLANKSGTPIGELEEVIKTSQIQESFWKSALKGILKFVGYTGMIADFSLLMYGWMKAAMGAGFYTNLLGNSVSVGALSAIVCVGIVVFGTSLAIGRSMRIAGGKTDDELGKW